MIDWNFCSKAFDLISISFRSLWCPNFNFTRVTAGWIDCRGVKTANFRHYPLGSTLVHYFGRSFEMQMNGQSCGNGVADDHGADDLCDHTEPPSSQRPVLICKSKISAKTQKGDRRGWGLMWINYYFAFSCLQNTYYWNFFSHEDIFNTEYFSSGHHVCKS